MLVKDEIKSRFLRGQQNLVPNPHKVQNNYDPTRRSIAFTFSTYYYLINHRIFFPEKVWKHFRLIEPYKEHWNDNTRVNK